MLAFAAAVIAGPEMYGRFAAAFDWRSDAAVAAMAASRIDAWIDPPPYAGRPPLVVDFKTADPQTLSVPENSILVVRGDFKPCRDARQRSDHAVGAEKRNARQRFTHERSK